MHRTPLRLVTATLTVLLPSAILADDLTVQLGTGDGFVILDNTGALERYRFEEATGNVRRNGALFLHTTGTQSTFLGLQAGSTTTTGSRNAAFGYQALTSVTSGTSNSAFGFQPLRVNTSGFQNSAFGDLALGSNTIGNNNSAFGKHALRQNLSGIRSSAFGSFALANSTGIDNTAVGANALTANATGFRNIALGSGAGSNQTIGSDNVYIGNAGVAGETGQIKIGTQGLHTDAFIAGIESNAVTGSPVLVTTSGELGVAASSLRFKFAVRDMGAASTLLMKLRPVAFKYRKEAGGDRQTQEYGLIAEEVAEVAPGLVVRDEQGEPYSVRYHLLTPMLLNETQKQQRTIEEQALEIQAQQEQISEQALRIAKQEQAIGRLSARLERVEARPGSAVRAPTIHNPPRAAQDGP